jgi:transcription initiation factor TFIIB
MQPHPSSSPSVCDACKSRLLTITDPDSGEIICRKCGMIVLDKIQNINQPEWNAFSNDRHKNKTRTGSSVSLAIYDMGLSTLIGRTDRDAAGKRINAEMHTTMQRLRTWDSRARIHDTSDISLINAFNKLAVLKDKLALPYAVVEKSAYIYRKAQNNGLSRGKLGSVLIAASVYAACREMNNPLTLSDIAVASNIKLKYLAKAYRVLLIELDIKVPLVDQTKCIAKVANKANLSEKTKRLAIRIMDEIRRKDYVKLFYSAGKNPIGFAATILYLSCLETGENKTQVAIAEAAGATEVTLRNRSRELKNKLNYQIRRSDKTDTE